MAVWRSDTPVLASRMYLPSWEQGGWENEFVSNVSCATMGVGSKHGAAESCQKRKRKRERKRKKRKKTKLHRGVVDM